MSLPPTIRRKLLLIGATGKQGRALIQALVSPHPPSALCSGTPVPTAAVTAEDVTKADKDSGAIIITTSEAGVDSRGASPASFAPQQDPVIAWDILAVTRNPSSPRAKSLLQLLPSPASSDEAGRHTLTLVQGDLDNPLSICAIFGESTASGSTPIWGVFMVLQYPGLNKKQGTDGTKPDLTQHIELRQGKFIVGLAHEYGVEALVYSSSIPAPLDEMDDDERNPTDGDKLAIEGYMKSLGETGGDRALNWIIIRPGFFMENFEGFMGSITYTVFREGLTDDTTLPLVASKDIGHVVAKIFRNHTQFLHKTVAITAEMATVREIMAAHQRATRKPIGGIPSSVAKLLIKMNAGTRRVLKLYQLSHEARKKGTYYPEFKAECDLARKICHLDNYEEWKRSEVAESGGTARTSVSHARVPSISEIQRPGTAEAERGTSTGSGIGFESGWNNVSIWKLVTGRS